jgi:hypothetical protein
MADFDGQTLVTGADVAPTSGSPGSPGAQKLVLLWDEVAVEDGDVTPPQVSAVTTGAIAKRTPVVFDVTDETGLRRVIVMASYRGSVYVVHNGDAFCAGFSAGSTREAITGGWRYSVRLDAGWSAPVTFSVAAIDTSGNEATQ